VRLTRQNQAFEQTRDSVLRHGDPVGRELLNLVVRRWEAQSQSSVASPHAEVARPRTS
jgi:hypothetical protein